MTAQYDKVKRNVRDEHQAIDPIRFQQISVTGTHALSDVFQDQTTGIWLFAEHDCWIKIGEAPEAVASIEAGAYNSFKLRSGIRTFFTILRSGQRISVIRATQNGALDIHEGR